MTWKNQRRRIAMEDRRAVGRMLVENLRFFQSVINSVADPVLVIGTDMQVKLINKAAREFPMHRELLEKYAENAHCYQVIYGSRHSCLAQGRECPLESRTVVHEVTLRDGRQRHYEVWASVLVGDNGEHLGIIETFRDITERRLAAEALRKSRDELELRVKQRTADLGKMNISLRHEVQDHRWAEDQLIQSLEHADLVYRVIPSPSAIFTVDINRIITSWNNKAEEVTGYSRDEVLGKPCSTFALNPCTTTCGVFADHVAKPIIGLECEIRTKDGRVRIISKNAELLKDADGCLIGAMESFEDITVKKDVERQLRTERDKFRGMLAAMGQGMHILNHDFEIEYQNEVLRAQFGDKIGEKCYQVYKQREVPCEVCRMHAAIESGAIQRTEEVMANGRFYEQSYAPFMDVDGQTKALILLRDVTEEKALQAETLRAGQLASIGELAASVAHEINNPINGIINYAQVLLDESAEIRLKGGGINQVALEVLQRIIKEGERIAGIVKNLLAFACQRDECVEEVVIDAVIDDALALIRHQLLKDGIGITLDLPDDLPPVLVNQQQLQQVFLNLFSNARYALNQRYKAKAPGKKVEILAAVVTLGGQPYLRTTIKDYGTGIPPEIVGHIFDPFFSSKKPGDGTGLGLSISHGLVRDMGGRLHVASEPGRFTAMMIDLPLTRPGAGTVQPSERQGKIRKLLLFLP